MKQKTIKNLSFFFSLTLWYKILNKKRRKMMLLTTMHCVKTPKRLEQQKIMKKAVRRIQVN